MEMTFTLTADASFSMMDIITGTERTEGQIITCPATGQRTLQAGSSETGY